MKLSTLTAAADTAAPPPEHGAVDIAGLTADSRKVEPGFLFAALAGSKADGGRFIADAVAKGAAAVVAGENADVPGGLAVPLIRTKEPRRTLALMAARFFEPQPETIVAVTGTSGKTSVADFTRQIFSALGRQAASLGTIGVVKPDGAVYGSLTTPDPVTLHQTLNSLAREGVTHVALEASSHGLDQYRLDGVKLAAGGYTNLGRDHLDYHPTVEAYLAAKLRLFSNLLSPGQPAVINADGERSEDVIAAARARGLALFTVGFAGEALRLVKTEADGFAQLLYIEHGGRSYKVRLPLLGTYQASNALVAAGLAISSGQPVNGTLAALEHLSGVKGRLEIVGEKDGGLLVVDYAHKPEALTAALRAVRPFASGRLICVFGCGGDRDRGKRPIMGAISAAEADLTIVTDDNPRSENPAAIRAEILAGAPGAREIGDRAEAIAVGAALVGAGDVLVVAGKGHETGQIVGDRVIPFSDHDCLRAALGQS